MIPTPAALLAGHPGHELRLFHWLERFGPIVHVLTDGSGSGRARTASTIDILSRTGSRPGDLMGAFTDHEIYRAILDGNSDAIARATLRLAGDLIEDGVRTLVADAFEFYNPTHDLCAVMATLAVERAQAIGGREIALYAYAVTKATTESAIVLELDDEAFDRKMAAAYGYEELSSEVDALIARIGKTALRREVLQPLGPALVLPVPESKPYYEAHGERRVASGRYDKVLRYEEHFLPFTEKLIAQVRAAVAISEPSAARV